MVAPVLEQSVRFSTAPDRWNKNSYIMGIRFAVCILTVALLGAIVATPALAQGRGRGAKQGRDDEKKAARDNGNNGAKGAPRAATAAEVQ